MSTSPTEKAHDMIKSNIPNSSNLNTIIEQYRQFARIQHEKMVITRYNP
jgi:hypothetical protein